MKKGMISEKMSKKISLSIINQLVEDIKNGKSFVHEIEYEPVTDVAYGMTRYDTGWRIMKIKYQKV